MSQAKPATAPQVKRVVIGVGSRQEISRHPPRLPKSPGGSRHLLALHTLGGNRTTVNNQAVGDRGADVTIREPPRTASSSAPWRYRRISRMPRTH